MKKIKIIVKKISTQSECFTFLVSLYDISDFFDIIFDYVEDIEDVTIRFLKSDESEE